MNRWRYGQAPVNFAEIEMGTSAMVAKRLRERAIQTASTITATALIAVSTAWASRLSFWNQPKLIPTFKASTRSKNGVTATWPLLAISNTNSSHSFEAWSSTSDATAATAPARR